MRLDLPFGRQNDIEQPSDGCEAIDVSNLTKMYGSFAAISDINLHVKKGEYMGLLGPNGAGKSTTLKAITGLLMPTSGTIRINGIDSSDHRRAMERVGCVIETPEPYPNFTPSEILEYVGRLYGLDDREIRIRSRDVLEEMKMWDWRNKPISGFSKGMRQRVTIAQSLLPNPEILILDEPTSGLDPRGMIEVRQILTNLKKRKMTLLISTHILSEVSELCGYVTMIRDGKSVISGKVSDLTSGLGGKSVVLEIRTLRPFTPEAIKDITGCQGVTESETMTDNLIKVSFNGSTEEQAQLSDVVFGTGLGVLAMNEKGASLEDLYMEFTKGEGVK